MSAEQARERNEGFAYEASQTAAKECACTHTRDEHDEEGYCEIRRCPCGGFHLPGDEPPGAAKDRAGRPDPSTHPEYWME